MVNIVIKIILHFKFILFSFWQTQFVSLCSLSPLDKILNQLRDWYRLSLNHSNLDKCTNFIWRMSFAVQIVFKRQIPKLRIIENLNSHKPDFKDSTSVNFEIFVTSNWIFSQSRLISKMHERETYQFDSS